MAKGSGDTAHRTELAFNSEGLAVALRVRFAPSPTGEMHVGNARAALYNWLVARKYGGQMILRIEDTDQSRSNIELTERLKRDLEWLGLDWDTEIPSQLARADLHRDALTTLVERGLVYRDSTPPGELAAWRRAHPGQPYRGQASASGAYRFRVPDDEDIVFTDVIHGEKHVDTSHLGDFVIARADGSPTFLLSNIVDDLEMSNLVIRGNDHLSNTSKQILLARGLGKTPPQYAHLPLIHGSDGAKLSKRSKNSDGTPVAISLGELRERGFLPEATLSYLSKLGWGEQSDDILTQDELIQRFTISTVSKSPARFDEQKLRHINGRFMRSLDPEAYADTLASFSGRTRDARLVAAAAIVQEKAQDLREAQALTEFLYRAPDEYEQKGWDKFMVTSGAQALTAAKELVASVEDWDEQALESALHTLPEHSNLKPIRAFQPLRLALSGSTISPGIYQSVYALGREETLARIDRALRVIKCAE